MPIRPEYRNFYRADWRRLRLLLMEQAGNVCEACRQPHSLLNVAPPVARPSRSPALSRAVPEVPFQA